MGARALLTEALRPLLPKAWRIIPYTDNLDTPTEVVVMLRQTRIERSPVNPQGGVRVTILATVIDPRTDPKRAEDALDEEVGTLVLALNKVEWALWQSAERVVFDDLHAYDITLTTHIKES